MSYENYLAHHGVKGMKWGVRDDREARTGLGRRINAAKEVHRENVNEKYKSKRIF